MLSSLQKASSPFISTSGQLRARPFFIKCMISDSSANHETSQKQGSGHDYMNDLNSVTRWRVSLLSDEERLKVLQAAKFDDLTFDERNADFDTKMRVLMKHIVDQDFKQADQPLSEASIRKKRKNKSSKIGIAMKTMKSSEGKIITANESSDNETQLSEDEIPDAPNNHQSTDQKLVEILSDELAITMRQFKPLGYTDRIGITRDLHKFRYRGKWPVASPGPKSPIEKNEWFADALCAITDAQQTLLVAIQESIEMRPNQQQCAHAYKMISIAAQAVAKIREDSNAPPGFKAVTQGNFLPSDVFSEETIQKTDRYMKEMQLEMNLGSIPPLINPFSSAYQQGYNPLQQQFLQQQTSMLPSNYVYPPRGYYGYQQRPMFSSGRGYDTFYRGFGKRGRGARGRGFANTQQQSTQPQQA
ncbi:MAG: hypothetical protein EZS28_008070 [Streblomastix strix]|uniref:Uncharacterized protein n=1 Tax=Streblomastix strix TaxID=222440 RepID=A0A5J4WNL3_9EUKA|nr:MAG: hypothetical protein EZS28_008070 [Streblomastix strix]